MNSSTQRTWRASVIVSTALLVGPGLARSSSGPGDAMSSARRHLDIEQRVAAQRAIEEVWWRHRVWPQENPSPKPPLSAVMSDEEIRAKVEDYLKKSNALETWWQRPVTAEQLQAELDRMSKQTRDPETLRELYAALGNDASLIAETLARPTLVERLIRNWYSADTRFHAAVRQEAEQAHAGCNSVSELEALGGEYVEQRFVRRGEDDVANAGPPAEEVVELDGEEWNDWTQGLARRFGTARADLPVQRVSGLQEESDRFFVTAVLELDADAAVVASVVWPKRSFEMWWAEARVGTRVEIEAEAGEYEIAAPLGGGCVAGTWEARLYVPTGRYRHTGVWTGSEMIVWGGEGYGGYQNNGGRYNPSTDTWTATSTGVNVPAARRDHTAVWTGTEMVVWGGYGGNYLNSGGRYNPSTDAWTATWAGANLPSARYHHTAVWTGTEMIVWGGLVSSGGSHLNTGGRYNPSTDTWTATSTGANVPSARSEHTAVWTGTELLVWGGYGGSYLNSGGRYDPSTDTWTATSTGASVPSARYLHTEVWTGTEMVVWGGYDGSTRINTGGRYNPSTDSWTATSTGANVPSARYLHTAVWTGTEMVVWGGGEIGFNSLLNTGGRYNPSTDSWAATATGANVPSPRWYHTAIWTGTEMVVWGGVSDSAGTTHLNTGSRYNPSTDGWTATSPFAPSPRWYHTAIWTGTEMVVWGGVSDAPDTTHLNTGGRYNPSTNTWTATSTGVNVPHPRSRHAAVWTGKELVVWGGGYRFGDYLNNGGRYNPSTNSWTATSTGVNVPVARHYHTAVWTGTEMVVWGGYGYGGYLKTGGRYNPSTDSWTATSTGAGGYAPVARSEHTAVWTGTEMIVWGGVSNGPSYLNTGGRYNPSTDSWTATSTGANVPNGRHEHTAVWTSTEMIVWGGYVGGSVRNTGGRYNPSTNTWTTTSIGANVPSERTAHTAVWTGAEMVVWGGYGVDNYSTGGRYNPSTNSWTATSTGVNVPSARSRHTAVWTSTQMVVWGGYHTDSTVGLYCLCTATPDIDGDGLGDACDSCPNDALNDEDGDGSCGDVDNCATWANPGQGVVLFGSTVRAENQSDFRWPESVAWELATGTFTTSASLGDFTVDFCVSGIGTIYADILRTPAPGSGRWYLWRPSCPAGSYSTGMPSEVGDRDAALIP